MVIQVEMKMRRTNKMGRLVNYLSDPIKASFKRKLREKLRKNIRTVGNRPLPYHTYPSQHKGQLEDSIFVQSRGKGQLVFGSYAPQAAVLEHGRRKMKRTKHPFIFKGYYPNPTVIAAVLNKSGNSKLNNPIPSFRGKGNYNSELSGKKMKTQNVRAITDLFRSNSGELSFSSKRRQKREIIKGIKKESQKYINKFKIPEGKTDDYRYGIYTVFAYNVKAIQPYRVFSQTAEWARKELVNEIKRGVRKVDYNVAGTRVLGVN